MVRTGAGGTLLRVWIIVAILALAASVAEPLINTLLHIISLLFCAGELRVPSLCRPSRSIQEPAQFDPKDGSGTRSRRHVQPA